MLSARPAPLAAEPEVVGSAYLIAAAVDPQRGFRSRRIILWLAESASADGLTARARTARMRSVPQPYGSPSMGMVPWYARNDQGSRMSDAGSLALVMGAGRGEGS